ncbi:J domain-containing protein [Nitratifractor sp.]
MLNRMIGIALFAAAFVVEFFWLGLAFGSVIVGLVLLIFAPAILLAPFQILFTLGLAFYHRDRLREAAEEWNRDYFRYEEEEIDPGEWHLGDLNRYYATLGCAPTDDMEKVKAAYRRLSKEFHPDRVEGRGMGEEFVAFAKRRMQEINEAYRAIRAAHSGQNGAYGGVHAA